MDPIRFAATFTISHTRWKAGGYSRLAAGLVLSCSVALAQQDDASLHQQLQHYQQAMLELNGSYTPSSAELYRDLADVHVQLGDVDAAIDAYSEALQVLRIQEGLASNAQLELLPIVNALRYRQQQWQRLDTHYHLAHSMARQLFGADDPRTISAATRLASWKKCVPLVMSVDGAQPSANACLANQNLDPEYYAAQQREKNNLVRKHLDNMRESFAADIDALEQDPSASLEQRVQAVLHLGDANLLAEDYSRARRQYARAWEMLSATPDHRTLRQRLLDRPVRALQGILDDLPFSAPLTGSGLPRTLSFEISENGDIENIQINAPPAALSQGVLGDIAVKLDQSVYRPRIVGGQPVRSSVEIPVAEL